MHKIYNLDSHRVAVYLEAQAKLLPLVQVGQCSCGTPFFCLSALLCCDSYVADSYVTAMWQYML